MELMATIVDVANDSSSAEANFSVTHGRFVADFDEKLKSGTYRVEILSPLRFNQPESVQKAIGVAGANLSGTGITQDGLFGEKIVDLTVQRSLR
jgi:hypothetical protein